MQKLADEDNLRSATASTFDHVACTSCPLIDSHRVCLDSGRGCCGKWNVVVLWQVDRPPFIVAVLDISDLAR